MRKSTKSWIKRKLAYFLVVLISINNFAAIVSDNDGSAFITKKDFENLKSEFNSQIERYNNSIDGKIDGAIANYLAGIGVQKKLVLDPIVSNYANINWVRKWYTYGSYVTWTNETTYTRTIDEWFEPFADKLLYTRDGTANIKGCGGRFEGLQAWEIGGDWRFDLADGPVFNAYCDSRAIKPTTNAIYCNYEPVMGVIIANSFVDIGGIHNRFGSNYQPKGDVSMWTSTDNGVTWVANNAPGGYTEEPLQPMDPSHPYASHWLEPDTPTGYQVISLFITANYQWNSKLVRWFWRPRNWELDFAPIYGRSWTWDGNAGRIEGSRPDIKTAVPSNWGQSNSKVWEVNKNGIHAVQLNNESTQENDFVYMMFGTDITRDFNILRYHPRETVGGSEQAKVRNDLSEWLTMPLEFTWLSAIGKFRWTDEPIRGGAVTYGNSVRVPVRIPYPERASLSQLSGGKFYNEKTPLRFGDGLPLSTYLTNSGDITIEFDYDFAISFGTVPSTAKAIEVDLKKTNFLSGEDDYYIGLVGDADDGVKVKDVTIETSTKHAKIVIDESDTKQGEELWMRIKPKSDTKGLKAKIKNLKVSMLLN